MTVRITNFDAEFIIFALSFLREEYNDFEDKQDQVDANERVDRLIDVFTCHDKIEIGE